MARKKMPDVLAEICSVKSLEIERLTALPTDELRQAAEAQPSPRDLRSAIHAEDDVALIAEVKKASPSAGLIRPDFDPVEIALAYERAGARCVSVLTDEKFFQGSPDYLRAVADAVRVPVLRKDFILDEVQVTQSRALGADACLLIMAALEYAVFRHLLEQIGLWGMTALVEVHDEDEMELAVESGANLIGINNRNLHTFEVDLEVSERLAPLAPFDTVIVAESGIRTREDVERMKDCGVEAVLVGESLMRADDVEAAARELVGV